MCFSIILYLYIFRTLFVPMGQYKHAPHFWFEYTAQRKTRRRVPKTVCRRCGRDFSSFPCNYLPLSLASVDFQVWGVQAPSFVDKPITTSRENGGIGRGNMCNGEQHMGTSFKITGFSVRDADSLSQSPHMSFSFIFEFSLEVAFVMS